MSQVSFQVSYRLFEYLAFLREEIAMELALDGDSTGVRVSRRDLWLARAASSVIGVFAFAYKVSRVGTCRFSIDRDFIVRESKSGKLALPWSDIVAVKRFRPGYLFAKAKGAMPVPYRVLTREQRDAIERHIAAWEARPTAS